MFMLGTARLAGRVSLARVWGNEIGGSFARKISAFPSLESATGRARKRRQRTRLVSSSKSTTLPTKISSKTVEEDVLPPYPKGRPWRVLWPHPHGNPTFVVETKTTRKIPRWSDIRKGWASYMETWEDGLRGEASPEKLRERQAKKEAASTASTINSEESSSPDLESIQSNVSQNLNVARNSAEDLLELAKEKSEIRSRDDVQKLAGDTMKLATECLREFMAGYREGRDREIDKMLHEYFQGDGSNTDSEHSTDATNGRKVKRRRKRKRAILR